MERRQATLSQREQRDIARNLVREKKLEEAYAEWLRKRCAAAPLWKCANRPGNLTD
jgi:peptidyl-prolyl cis-trans isomerase SurA